MIKAAVTTSLGDTDIVRKAEAIAIELDAEYLPRLNKSIETLLRENNLDYIIVVERQQVILRGETTISWHPSMAVPRIKAFREGKIDPMLEAMDLKQGYSVLDCTLGLASDALVAAYAAGPSGRVIGLEASKYLAFLTKWGLNNYPLQNKHLAVARAGITVLNRHYQAYLSEQEADSFDIVYVDPMFGYALKKSASLNVLRPLAIHEDVTLEHIKAALRVAKYRVVMKQNAKSVKAAELLPDKVIGGRYSPVSYYVWEKGKILM